MSTPIKIYIYFTLFLILFFTVLTYFKTKKRKQKKLKEFRDNWGKPNLSVRNFELIENYSLLTQNSSYHNLTAQTILDLDIYDLFGFIDRTGSKPGQQYLFNKLLHPVNNIDELEQFNRQVEFFSANQSQREDTQMLLEALSDYDAYFITTLLDSSQLTQSKWSWLYVVDTLSVVLLLLLAVKFPVLLIWLIIPLAINIFLYFRNKNYTSRFNRSFPQLNQLIQVCKILTKKDIPFESKRIIESIDGLKSFQRKFRLLNFSATPKDEFSQALLFMLELVKAFFLIETHSFNSCIATLKNKKENIDTLIRYAGSIDAAISTASLRIGAIKYSVPEFTSVKKEMAFKNLYHPLVESCVANSIIVKNKSILITGSNMSGKSTFIRTVAINAILAQTIYTCFADQFISPFVKVFSSIRITDSLQDGTSYYLEEVNTVGSLIKEADKPFPHLFILDEVFKGTNTIERIAAAKAILSYLNKNDNLVFVSTHDIELASMLNSTFDLYHFSEDIDHENIKFDHHLKAGVLTTRNAIKLLSLSGYPNEIIEAANSIANKY